jgi:hypothetical protein
MKRVPQHSIALLALMLGATSPRAAAPGASTKAVKQKKEILVYAHRKGGVIEYVSNDHRYSGEELGYLLGERHMDAAKDSEVVVVLEDDLLLSDVKDISAMALKAGFTDVRAFVYWEGTGNTAELLFGPVVKLKTSGRAD